MGSARNVATRDPALDITEAALQRAVIDLGRSLGWGTTKSVADRMAEEAKTYGVPTPPLDGLTYHPRYSLGSEPGWPDLVMVRRRDRRLVFAELKAQKGVLSARQLAVLDLLESLGLEVHTWRPADLASGYIAEVLR